MRAWFIYLGGKCSQAVTRKTCNYLSHTADWEEDDHLKHKCASSDSAKEQADMTITQPFDIHKSSFFGSK